MQQNLDAILGDIDEKFNISFDQSDDNRLFNPKQPTNKQSANPQILLSHKKTSSQSMNHEENSQKSQDNSGQQSYQANSLYQGQKTSQNDNQIKQKNHENIDRERLKIDISQKYEMGVGQIAEHFQNQQQQKQYYKSLNLKFELALNKIHNKSSNSTNRGFGHDQFIQRLQYYKKQKNNGLTQLKKQKQDRQKQKLKFKPLINSRSVQMLQHYKPIEHRYEDVIKQKERKIQRQKTQKMEKFQEIRLEEQRQIQEYHQKLREKYGTMRTGEEYFDAQKKWLQRKQKDLQAQRALKSEKAEQQTTFQPQINKKSSNIMKKKKDRVIIFQKVPENKANLKDPNCTFKPKISRNIKY